MKVKIILGILFIFTLMDFVSAETFSIDDSFKVGWTEGTDNYEAIYKVLRIETTPEGNVTTLLLMPPGIIGISNKKQGDTYTLGTNAKIHFDEVYVSGDDKWISISLENAQFKDESSSSGSEENEEENGGWTIVTCSDSDGGKNYFEKGETIRGSGTSDEEKIDWCDYNEKVLTEHYCGEDKSILSVRYDCPGKCEGGVCIEEEENEEENEVPILCNGCILGDECIPVGYRTNDKYCDINSELVNQLEAESTCENNFECFTNLCIDKQCVSRGLWQKFTSWLNRLFG